MIVGQGDATRPTRQRDTALSGVEMTLWKEIRT
jgi:hypothetical protein